MCSFKINPFATPVYLGSFPLRVWLFFFVGDPPAEKAGFSPGLWAAGGLPPAGNVRLGGIPHSGGPISEPTKKKRNTAGDRFGIRDKPETNC